jgi:hypothetical protein
MPVPRVGAKSLLQKHECRGAAALLSAVGPQRQLGLEKKKFNRLDIARVLEEPIRATISWLETQGDGHPQYLSCTADNLRY